MKSSIKFYATGILLIALVLGFVANQTLVQPSVAQTTNSPNQIGRYQLVGAQGSTYIFDSATGKCWIKYGPGVSPKNWEEISPVGR